MSNLKLVFYVKKGKPYVYLTQEALKERPMFPRSVIDRKGEIGDDYVNGKIIIECDFDVEEITYAPNPSEFDRCYFSPKEWCYDYQEKYGGLSNEELLKHSCLTNGELSYRLDSPANDKKVFCKDTFGYAMHIKNLHIFDKPKELSEVCKYDFWASEMFGISATSKDLYIPITKAPHNMCRVFDPQNHYEMKILIPISSQEAHNILNGKQDVLIRRNVLKEMAV